MSYIEISNPGVADYRSLTLLGVSTTRYGGAEGTIGNFGSGFKYSLALLLRQNIKPIIICGNLKMEIFSKEITVKGTTFNQVCVKYSGKDLDGNTKNSTEELGFTSEYGVADWNNLSMCFREFMANAIDGAILSGASHKAVEINYVEKPRAAKGSTSVLIPIEKEDYNHWKGVLSDMFLHVATPELLKEKCLPKLKPEEDKVRIYKRGVLVACLKGKSVFDYNLGEELSLDESRNASDWDIKYAVSKALRDESSLNIARILEKIIVEPDIFEAKIDSYYLANDGNAERSKKFQVAWAAIAGQGAVATRCGVDLDSFISAKGLKPVRVPEAWRDAIRSYGVATDETVLTASEQDGKIVYNATKEMTDVVDKVWSLFEAYKITKNKTKPAVKAFNSVMDGGTQVFGYYLMGGDTVYLHQSLGGKMLFNTCLEEITHYATGSLDHSRDIQDFLFGLITEMAY